MEHYNLMKSYIKQASSLKAVDGLTPEVTRMSITLSKPKKPENGSTYYDVDEGQMYQHFFGHWHPVGAMSTSAVHRFAWNINGLELQILHYTWWIKHGQEIIEWLERGNGLYERKDQTIQFNTSASATYFKLKWD